MKKQVENFLENNKGNTLIIYLENERFFSNSNIDNYTFKDSELRDNAITIHEGLEVPTLFSFTLNGIESIAESEYSFVINYDDETMLRFEIV